MVNCASLSMALYSPLPSALDKFRMDTGAR
jgi:hypothetical protein